MAGKQCVWLDGRFVAFEKANVHILTHSLQYGSGMFEGMRTYKTVTGRSVFRLDSHIKRFMNTAKIYAMDLGYDENTLKKAVIGLIKKNGLESCYIRPFAFYNDTRIGIDVLGKKVSVAIAAIPFGDYFENKNKGIRCSVSSWRRINSDILPPLAKGSANYRNSVLAGEEARKNGTDEAILLTERGYVAEGPGENIFLVRDSKLITPSGASDILMGITRDSVIKIAESSGILVEEREVHREELYIADELFFSGTAAEITPIVSVDGRKIGSGHIGPLTKLISDYFSQVVHGENNEFKDWLTPV
jgi:branched-chain amino acid aminotransferase